MVTAYLKFVLLYLGWHCMALLCGYLYLSLSVAWIFVSCVKRKFDISGRWSWMTETNLPLYQVCVLFPPEFCLFCCFMACHPRSGSEPPHRRGFMITLGDTPYTRWDCTGRVISPAQRPLPDNTQHSHETGISTSGGIGTRNHSKRAAAERSFRLRGHWDRHPAVHCM